MIDDSAIGDKEWPDFVVEAVYRMGTRDGQAFGLAFGLRRPEYAPRFYVLEAHRRELGGQLVEVLTGPWATILGQARVLHSHTTDHKGERSLYTSMRVRERFTEEWIDVSTLLKLHDWSVAMARVQQQDDWADEARGD